MGEDQAPPKKGAKRSELPAEGEVPTSWMYCTSLFSWLILFSWIILSAVLPFRYTCSRRNTTTELGNPLRPLHVGRPGLLLAGW